MPEPQSAPPPRSPFVSKLAPAISSMRFRLTLWYSAVLALVLLVLSLTIYWMVKSSVTERTDADLTQLATSFLATFHAELQDPGNSGGPAAAAHQSMIEHNYRDHSFAVLDSSGAFLATSQDLLPVEKSAVPAPDTEPQIAASLPACRAAATSSARSFQTVWRGHRQFRCYSAPFTANGVAYRLLIVQSLRPQRAILEKIRLAFAWLIPLAILLAATGGYFLARKSLAPVLAMSVQTDRITATNLHQRLPIGNPSDELGRLATTFNRLLDRLDQAFDRQRRFIADASHELRTPVAILRGEAEVAISQPSRSPAEYRESLVALHREAARLAKIVEDLFTLTRADSGQHPISPRDFYLDELVAECARSVRTLADAKQLSLLVDPQPEIPVRADELLLRRMLLNLLDNAIKYTPPGGSIRLASRATPSGAEISVVDTGPGIPTDLHSRVFERFFRVDQARSRGAAEAGAGLGLSIARWIAEAHHGRLELSRSDPTGSTFTISLPRDACQSPSASAN